MFLVPKLFKILLLVPEQKSFCSLSMNFSSVNILVRGGSISVK